MLTFLPAGLLGLVVASLIAAFMSTISTHLNWGSSYIVYDFYKRFLNKKATEKQMVLVGRISTVLMIVLAGLLSLILEEAKEGFNLILQIGAGTGLLFILRWFWKAINPYSEIAAMIISFVIAIGFLVLDKLFHFNFSHIEQLLYGVTITTVGWVAVTLYTKNLDLENPDFDERAFGGTSKCANIKYKVISIFAGCIAIYSSLFAIGYIIYGMYQTAVYNLIAFVLATSVIIIFWNKNFDD